MLVRKACRIVSASVLLSALLHAASNSVTSQGTPLKWTSGAGIPFVINPGGVPGFTGDLERLVVAGAVRDSFRAWTQVPGAAISFNDLGLTTAVNRTVDGTNLISFQSTNTNFPPGVLAITFTFASQQTGQIVDADILFNPAVAFSPVGVPNTTDIVAVATHEIGHLLGLNHSGVQSSIMKPSISDSAGVAVRTIAQDDASAVAVLYPLPTFAPSVGTIEGFINDSQGAPVKSAHVVAVSVPQGSPVASQVSGNLGFYRIAGLPPGDYRLLVEPLNGPTELANLDSFYANGRADFATTFLGGLSTPTTLSMAAGQTVQASVQLPPNPPALLNIELTGVASAGFIAEMPLFVRRGVAYQAVATEATGAQDTTFSFSSPDLSAVGATFGQPFAGLPARRQQFTVASSALLGPSNLALSNANGTSAMPGGVVVTVNPQAGAPLVDSASFRPALAPGTFVSIFGTDLAGSEQVLTATPAPTSLSGVSVRIGNRFAPLFFAGPGQINALIPFEVSGQTTVQVFAGPTAGGNTLNLNLSPTAPGIFTMNSQGFGQGAVLNNPDPTLAAAVGSVPGNVCRPTRRGEIISVYASGLGPVTPPMPTGVAAGAGGSAIPTLINQPTVRIGGINAQVQFAGLAPGFVGLYQVNVLVPANAPVGDAVSLQITTFEGQSSNSVTIAVAP